MVNDDTHLSLKKSLEEIALKLPEIFFEVGGECEDLESTGSSQLDSFMNKERRDISLMVSGEIGGWTGYKNPWLVTIFVAKDEGEYCYVDLSALGDGFGTKLAVSMGFKNQMIIHLHNSIQKRDEIATLLRSWNSGF